jgi:hypothetical protein
MSAIKGADAGDLKPTTIKARLPSKVLPISGPLKGKYQFTLQRDRSVTQTAIVSG